MSDSNVSIKEFGLEPMTSAINFCELVYFTLPRHGFGLTTTGKLISPERKSKLASELAFVSSSDRATSFALEMKSLITSVPMLDIQKLCTSEPEKKHLIIKDSENRLKKLALHISKSLQYKSVACYSSFYGEDDFIGVFILLSELTNIELDKKLNCNWIYQHLDLLNFYYPRASASLSRSIYNPGNIPSKTLDVLRLSSRGESSKAIAEKLFLTTRGVEYHLEKAKRLLNAANKVQLISLAKDCCLI